MPAQEDRLQMVGETEPVGVALLDYNIEDVLERRWSHESTISPFTTRARDDLRSDASAVHHERSQKAQTADESFNAPAAPSYRKWIEHPNRYDMPGVDSIPPERMVERAERILGTAQAAGAVEKVVEERLDLGATGSFNVAGKRVTVDPEGSYGGMSENNDSVYGGEPYPREQKGYSLAHEVGHAIDTKFAPRGESFWSETNLVPDDDEAAMVSGSRIFGAEPGTLAHEAKQASVRIRGEFEDEESAYRSSAEELAADSIASAVLEPRAARRDHPELFEKVQDELLNPLKSRAEVASRQ